MLRSGSCDKQMALDPSPPRSHRVFFLMIFRTTAAAWLLLAIAVPARAQDAAAPDTAAADTTPRTSLRKGAWSLVFDVPAYGSNTGSAAFGVWEMVGARTNLGLTLGVTVYGRDREAGGTDQTDASTYVQVGVAAKRYLATARAVAPFVVAGVFGRGNYLRRDGAGYEEQQRGWGAGVEAGVGVEWFPARHLSVGGHTGFTLASDRYTAEQERPDGTRDEIRDSGGSFGTYTTALSVQIYF